MSWKSLGCKNLHCWRPPLNRKITKMQIWVTFQAKLFAWIFNHEFYITTICVGNTFSFATRLNCDGRITHVWLKCYIICFHKFRNFYGTFKAESSPPMMKAPLKKFLVNFAKLMQIYPINDADHGKIKCNLK